MDIFETMPNWDSALIKTIEYAIILLQPLHILQSNCSY